MRHFCRLCPFSSLALGDIGRCLDRCATHKGALTAVCPGLGVLPWLLQPPPPPTCGRGSSGLLRARLLRPGLTGFDWGHLARFMPCCVVVAEGQTFGGAGGGLDVVAVIEGEAALGPQAHLTAPYWPCCSLDQRTAGEYPRSGLMWADVGSP